MDAPRLPLGHFLRLLRDRYGFEIGATQVAEVSQLVGAVGDRVMPERLGELLVGLIAHTPEQQRQFTQLWDTHYGRAIRAATEPAAEAQDSATQLPIPEKKPRFTAKRRFDPFPSIREYLPEGVSGFVLAVLLVLVVWRLGFTLPGALAAVGVGAGCWLLYRQLDRRYRRGKGEAGKPLPLPHIRARDWQLVPPEQSLQLADRLRTRVGRSLNTRRIDLQATLDATLRRAGTIVPQFVRTEIPPRYLVLIDQTYLVGTHQPPWFAYLTELLAEADVRVEHYAYLDDPRTVWRPERPSEMHRPADLYEGQRLLIFGTGDSLVNHIEGGLHPGVEQAFDTFRHRALLTPRAPGDWGFFEATLATQFSLAPADIEGMGWAIDTFDRVRSRSWRSWYRVGRESARLAEAYRLANPEADDLNTWLVDDPALFDWIAACALFPRLDWRLTLELGRAVSQAYGKGGDLLRKGALNTLVRIDWFRRGGIPTGQRRKLLTGLSERAERAARERLAQLHEQDPASAERLDVSRLFWAENQYQLTADPKTRRKLRREMRKLRRTSSQSRTTDPLLFDRVAALAGLPSLVDANRSPDPGQARLTEPKSDSNTVPEHFDFPVPEMVFIKGGTFLMGSEDEDADGDEKPAHEVIVNDFELGKFPVIFDEYDAFCEATDREKPDDEGWGRGRRPVINVSWNDATAYAAWLSEQTGQTWRLPTEAEWEYAAGGGSGGRTKWAGTNEGSALGDYAWYGSNSSSKTLPVGGKRPNALGLHDMSGNVWEWCQDWYDRDYYATCQRQGTVRNPQGPAGGSVRVLRGGSWISDPHDCRVAYRSIDGPPTHRYYILGFRLARTP